MDEQTLPPTLSLVTGALNRPESLHRLIESIKAHTRVDWELIISDASDAPLYINDPRIHRIVEKPRLGHTKGYNVAFKECSGYWVINLNDDAEVLPGYDTESIAFMIAHKTIGLGALSYSEPINHKSFHTNNWRQIPYANFGIIKRSLGDQLGWYDEDFVMYGADNSLTFRVLLAGYGVSPIPGAHIIHHAPKDKQRMENDKLRLQGGEVMQRKYAPYYDRMLKTYQLYKVGA